MAIEYQFLSADYFGTGEGRTIMLLVTRGYGQEKTPNHNAVKEFIEHFSEYMARGIKFHERDEFLETFENALPPFVHKFLTDDTPAGNFSYRGETHMNFS